MSSIEKMLRCDISGSLGLLDTVLKKVSDSGCFHMEDKGGGEKTGEENPYKEPLRRISEISAVTGCKPAAAELKEYGAGEAEAAVERLAVRARELSERLRSSEEALSQDSGFLEQMSHLTGEGSEDTLNVDVKTLFAIDDNGNIKVRFGRIPQNSYEKLDYYADKGIYFSSYGYEKGFRYGFFFFPISRMAENEKILESLYFERIHIPDFLHGDLKTVKKDLQAKVTAEKAEVAAGKQDIERFNAENSPEINSCFTYFKTRHDLYELRRLAETDGEKFTVSGFIPAREEQRFRELFAELGGISLMTDTAERDKGDVPVKLNVARIWEPFSMFVDLYGLPGPHDPDPTAFLGFTYTLLFGIMFGDLGQGFVLMLLGFFLARKNGSRLGRIMKRLGCSSMIFGTLYGSVFGFEELLDPVYESMGIHFLPFHPIANINTVLYAAIGLGIVIIIISILVNTVMGFATGDKGRALFSNSGLAGLIFYGALLMLLLGPMIGIKTGGTLYVLCLIVLPLIIMFLKEPLSELISGNGFHIEGKPGDFIASSFFECFEYLLGYATNTLSFVRVGGFVLSHAGMMSVVLALANMAGNASPIVIILGNIFVMALEGLLSGIQVLRLEYYEMFSRYYSGGGTAFKPVGVDFNEIV